MNEMITKYSRQILFTGIGEEGQRKLLASSVVVLGCGALGTVIASALVRGGIGHIKIIDRDFIEESNLQRQVLFDEEDIKQGLPKAVAAEQKLRKINSTIEIESVVADINYTNIEQMIVDADLVLDGSDNFETRFLLNDAAVKHRIPWIYGACIGSSGLTMTIIPFETPCLRCIFETAPPPGMSPTCDTAGIISPIVNIIASIEVTEAIKMLIDNRDELNRELISIDVWEGRFQKLNIANAREIADCPTCKKGNYEFLNATEGSQVVTLCGRDAVQITPNRTEPINFESIAGRLKASGEVRFNKFMLKFKVGDLDITLFPDGRAIIKGTKDTSVARGVYAKYIGV